MTFDYDHSFRLDNQPPTAAEQAELALKKLENVETIRPLTQEEQALRKMLNEVVDNG